MRIATTRFGEIDIRESDLIAMKGSILGFGHLKRFALIVHDQETPLWWLQSADDPAVAFVVINPFIVMPDYKPTLHQEDRDFLEIRKDEDLVLLAIVTVRSQPFRVTVNIRAPILVNAGNRMATQIVLEDPEYPIQYDVLDHKTRFDAWLAKPCNDSGRLVTTATSL